MKKNTITILLLLISIHVFAQRERNNIYLFDCTQSMQGYGGALDIWDNTKSFLKADIGRQHSDCLITLIPFQGKAYEPITFLQKDFDWNKINKQLDEYVKNITNTNICNAWDQSLPFFDKNKDNYLILLTDGKDNHVSNGVEQVCQRINNWCNKYKNSFAFYVMLTKEAQDQRIVSAIENCKNIFLVEADGQIPTFGMIENNVITANTLELDKISKIGVSTPGVYETSIDCNDPYFEVELLNNKIYNGIADFKVISKYSLSELNECLGESPEYQFNFKVKSKGLEILNPDITVNVINKPERVLHMVTNPEVYIGEATFFERFLFWPESEQDTLYYNLETAFNNEAKKDGSKVTFKIVDGDGLEDFTVIFNKEVCPQNTITMTPNQSSDIIGIVFDKNANTGKRFLQLKTINPTLNLDRINDTPTNDYQLSLRSHYKERCNPLAIILFWLAVILITALILWFCILRRQIYPTIKITNFSVLKPYGSTRKIKGAYMLVCSNTPIKQSAWTKIFKGRIVNEINPVWTSPLAFVPYNRRTIKGLSIKRNRIYTTPLRLDKKGNIEIITNSSNNEKVEVKIF